MIDAMQALLGPLRRGLANLVARAVVQLVSDTPRVQTLQLAILDGETRADCERIQQYGFTSVPQPGAEAVVMFPGGIRDHALVIAVDDRRYRLRGLQPGEVAIYTDQGDQVVLKRGGTIEVHASTAVAITAPSVTCSGDLTVVGSVTAGGDVAVGGDVTVAGGTGVTVTSGTVKAGAIDLKTHKHSGVTAGPSLSGTPV